MQVSRGRESGQREQQLQSFEMDMFLRLKEQLGAQCGWDCGAGTRRGVKKGVAEARFCSPYWAW